jgi:hypothetical protein
MKQPDTANPAEPVTRTVVSLHPDFDPRCPSCGCRGLLWFIRRSDGAPVGECLECDDGLSGSPDDVALIEWVRTKEQP